MPETDCHCQGFEELSLVFGTELGFGDFRTTGEMQMSQLLPAWCCPDSHVMEIDVSEEASARSGVVAASPSIVFESDISEAATRPQSETLQQEHDKLSALPEVEAWFKSSAAETWFLPGSIAIPGTLHIVKHALEDVTSKFKMWNDFHSDLQLFEQLWSQGRLSRFINYCVRNTPLECKAQELLCKKLGSLYMKRWNEVVGFCKKLLPFLPIIKACWSERQYMTGIADASQEKGQVRFDPKALTAVLAKPVFFAYLEMILALLSCIEYMGHWSESCPCHQDCICNCKSRCHVLQIEYNDGTFF